MEQAQESPNTATATRPWLKHYDQGVPHSIGYLKTPLFCLLEEAAQRYPNRPAIHFFGRHITYRELDYWSNRFGNALLKLGVQRGDRVAIMLPNCPQMVIAYYGALKAGAIVVLTNPLYTERELEHQLQDSGAETIVTLTKMYPTVAAVRSRTPLHRVIVTNIKDFFPPMLRLLFTLFRETKEGHRLRLASPDEALWLMPLLQRAAPKAPEVEIEDNEEVAVLQYTGGTTGLAKGAMLTHDNLVANAAQVRAWLPDVKEGQEVFLCVIPFFHSYGMTVCMNFAISAAAAMVLLPRFEVKEVLTAIDRYQPTIFPGVPAMYVAINNYPEVEKYRLRSIRACISGAAPLPVEVQRRFEELTGARLVEGYGLSEASPVTHSNPIYGLRKTGTIGLPFPDVDCKIVDLESGQRELPIGESGELAIHGPQVMKGYWNQPEETAHTLRDGWLYTGDVARQDEDGFFAIVDRKKELIITGGFNVYPREVEEVLYEHPKVKEAAVVAVPDLRSGEVVKAFVVLKEGEQTTPEELISFCQGKLARYKVPRYIEFRDELPKTLIGKVLRRALREEAAGPAP